jgi:DNA topoisomerase-3
METAGKRIDDEALRAAMKDTGLGTPATRASIIETLLRREYIARDKNHLVATPLGESLIAQIPLASLASPELTGQWEARLASIARGKDTRAAFMADIARYVRQIVDAVRGAPAPPAPPPGSSPPPAWQSRGKGKRRGGGTWKGGASSWKSGGAPSPAKRARKPRDSSATAKPRKKRASTASTGETPSRTPSPTPSRSPSSMPSAASSMPSRSTSPALYSPPIAERAPSTPRGDLSVESTAWLSELILSMAPDKPK